MLRKAIGWVAVILIAMWVLKRPDQVGALVQQVFSALSTLAAKL